MLYIGLAASYGANRQLPISAFPTSGFCTFLRDICCPTAADGAAVTTTLPLQLRLEVAVLLDPRSHVVSVTLDPRDLASDGVLALQQRLEEVLGVLVLEEGLHLIQLLLLGEAAGADRDHATKDGRVATQSLGDIGPLVAQPREESLDALGMAAKAAGREVDVLTLDLARQDEVKGPLDKFRVLGTAEAAERSVALVAAGRGPEEVQDLVVLADR